MHKEQYILEAYSKEKNNALICIQGVMIYRN